MKNFDLDFNFTASGSCKIMKKKNQLNPPSKIKTRELSLKNFVRIFLNMLGKK